MSRTATAASAAPLLGARNLSLRFDQDSERGLGPVDLELSPGQVLTIEGPSGSGKSTLLRCLAQLDARAQGDVVFRGAPVKDAALPGFRRDVVYVAQSPPRFPLSVAESLRRVFELRTAQSAYDSDRAQYLCQRLSLPDDVLDRWLPDLSGGEAQRVALVRALLLNPAVLLLDEPTSALDPDARDRLVHEVGEWLDATGHAAVVVAHEVSHFATLVTHTYDLATNRLRGATPT